MFEETIRKSIEHEKYVISLFEGYLKADVSPELVIYWNDEIKKHEYAIDILNGVLNLVSLT